jgi:hypothetical protein
MEIAKTLWMLDVPYESIKGSVLVPLYAVDEQEAWIEAFRWALRHDRTLPQGATLIHFPNGFRAYRRMLPGSEESTSEQKES